MSSRRSVRQLVVAVLLGVLVGGGLMAVTPAGAEVSNAVATNWKKIWKKNLKPLADRRYYTKAQSNAAYQPKGSYEAAGSGYSKAETYSKAEADAKYAGAGSSYSKAEADAKYAGAGSSYSKAESDAKYTPVPTVIRGIWALSSDSTNEAGFTEIVYPQLAAAPTVRYIPLGGALPVGCSGTPAAPNAAAGFLCVFESAENNMGTVTVTAPDFSGANPNATAFGTTVWAFSNGAIGYVTGTYALRPAASGFATGARMAAVPDAVPNPSNRP